MASGVRVMCSHQRRLPWREKAFCLKTAVWRVFFHWPISAPSDVDGGATNVSRCDQHHGRKWLPPGVIVTKEEYIGKRMRTHSKREAKNSTENV